ncbi:hypothetical protein N431DRAFT_494159 [Stipitochalara longipes BDJ]|nr:hypothetical protein N431DRAFT_494159 [Stipitochalara longipes BDJ]
MEYNKWATYDLKAECAHRELSTTGNKFDFVRRLVNDDVEKRRTNVYVFDKYNDPEGAEERQYIENEIGFKRWAHVTVSDAEINYHTRQIAKAVAEKRSGVEALVEEKKQALLSVENRVKGLLPRSQGEEDAMEVDSVEVPMTGSATRKRSISPSAASKEAKKMKWELEVEGDPMALGLPRVMRSSS